MLLLYPTLGDIVNLRHKLAEHTISRSRWNYLLRILCKDDLRNISPKHYTWRALFTNVIHTWAAITKPPSLQLQKIYNIFAKIVQMISVLNAKTNRSISMIWTTTRSRHLQRHVFSRIRLPARPHMIGRNASKLCSCDLKKRNSWNCRATLLLWRLHFSSWKQVSLLCPNLDA